MSGRGKWAVVAACALVLWARPATAWNETGHIVAALIGWDRLPTDIRASAARALHEHPRFHEDFEAHLPSALAKASAAEQDRWYFARAATWPDEARRFDSVRDAAERDALIERYHHGSWHYINLPIYLRESDREQLRRRAPSMRWSPALDAARLNLVQAIAMLSARLCAPDETREQRALALTWLIHLLGDLEQPLHTAALYADPQFPDGDRGGNDITVGPHGNLHAVWDDAFGDERRMRRLNAMARELGRAVRGDSDVNVAAWARQGRLLAESVAYSPAIRRDIATTPHGQPVRVFLDAQYLGQLHSTAREQIGVAGERIARVLEALLADAGCRR